LLKPGGYAQVSIHLSAPPNVVTVPASALVFNQQGLRVATIAAGDRVVMKPVKIARDLGTEVEIDAGLSATDRVIDNPPDSIANGQEVHVQQEASSK
jgi:multidrug efflux pump subunit AcrA (membrane-fusion protein)